MSSVIGLVNSYPGILVGVLFFAVWPFVRRYIINPHKMDLIQMRSNVNLFVKTAGYNDFADIDMARVEEAVDRKISNCGSNVEAVEIAKETNKGYSILKIKHHNKNDVVNPHHHNHSDELMYIINGKAQVILHNEGKDDDESIILNVGDNLYIKRKQIHSFISLENNTQYIVVAKPPIFNSSWIKRIFRKLVSK